MTEHRQPGVRRRVLAVAGFAALAVAACTPAGAPEASWPPLAKKWYDRATVSYQAVDIEDAQQAVDNALRIDPHRDEIRMLAARIALASLDYERAVQLLQGIQTTEARGIRGRALWYSGQLDRAADELDQLLADPEVRDPWAQEVAKLARRGAGRTPFKMSGAMLVAEEMPQIGATTLVVPVEVNGEPALGMIATGTAEAFVDSSAGNTEPSWVSLRFGERVEVKDVPAFPKDLSGISRQLNAPIKLLIGVNLLRHLHCTFDFAGSQFVVRNFEPPPPPHATTVKLAYLRGGGMVMRSAIGSEDNAPMASFMVDTSMTFPVALDEAGWKKAGVALSSLKPVPHGGSLKHGTLPLLKVGAFEVPGVPAVYGAPIKEVEEGLGVHLDGIVGSGLLAAFRVTLADRGLTMWLEDMPAPAMPPPQQGAAPGTSGGHLELSEPGVEGPPAERAPPRASRRPAARHSCASPSRRRRAPPRTRTDAPLEVGG